MPDCSLSVEHKQQLMASYHIFSALFRTMTSKKDITTAP